MVPINNPGAGFYSISTLIPAARPNDEASYAGRLVPAPAGAASSSIEAWSADLGLGVDAGNRAGLIPSTHSWNSALFIGVGLLAIGSWTFRWRRRQDFRNEEYLPTAAESRLSPASVRTLIE